MKKSHTFWLSIKEKDLVPLLQEMFQKYGERIAFNINRFDFAEFQNLEKEAIFLYFLLFIISANAKSS